MPGSLRYEYKDTLSGNLKNFFKKVGIEKGNTSGIDKIAKTKCGLQMINFVINGSNNEQVTPPIWWGNLRASGSVHVGSEFVGGNNLYPVKSQGGQHEETSANTSPISENPDTITIAFNTAYATRMHETNWNPGPISEQSGNTGNKFLEKHLSADRETILAFYEKIFFDEIAKILGGSME